MKLHINKIILFIKKWRLLIYIPIISLTFSNINLRQNIIELHKNVAVLQQTNEDLLRDMVLFNRSYEEFPLPIWQKVKRDMHFISQYFNPAYEKAYFTPLGFTRYEKMGETDFDNFDYKTAVTFYNRDLQIAIDGGSKMFTESFLNEKGKRIDIEVLKWRVIERKDTLVYGMVLPKKN